MIIDIWTLGTDAGPIIWLLSIVIGGILGTIGWHYKKPDLSNLIKFIEDAFNNVLWKDDALISYMFATKKYSFEPKTMIFVKESV